MSILNKMGKMVLGHITRDQDLCRAARDGDPEMVRILIARGAGVNWSHRRGYRGEVLLGACRSPKGNAETVALLLKNGADPNSSMRPLFGAVYNGNLEILDLLLANGAEINQRDSNGSALIWAIRQCPPEVVPYLLSHEADPNLCSLPDPRHVKDAPRTPLMTAALMGWPEMVRALLEHGAEVNTRDEAGHNALDLTRRFRPDPHPYWRRQNDGITAIIPLLEAAGAVATDLCHEV